MRGITFTAAFPCLVERGIFPLNDNITPPAARYL